MDIQEVSLRLARADLKRITFSCPRKEAGMDAEQVWKKMVIRPVFIKNQTMFQAEHFTRKQAFQRNYMPEELSGLIKDMLENRFLELNASWPGCSVLVKISKKGKIYYKESPEPVADTELSLSQNREKRYRIQQQDILEPLMDLGVVTKDGKIVASRYDKFRQIDRFVALIDDEIDPNQETIRIIDFGCGKSYLSFVLYGYLTRVRGLHVLMTGLDLKADVIKKCNETAEKYGYADLHFEVGDIAMYHPETAPDMVISLHACDTATDYALYNAISWNTKQIFAVPCCQHEVNAQLTKRAAGSLSEYGILKERFSALLTDACRADLLRSEGYHVDVVEFVDMAHSPKNIMLRASKIVSRNTGRMAALQAKERVETAMRTYQVKPLLYTMLYPEQAGAETMDATEDRP